MCVYCLYLPALSQRFVTHKATWTLCLDIAAFLLSLVLLSLSSPNQIRPIFAQIKIHLNSLLLSYLQNSSSSKKRMSDRKIRKQSTNWKEGTILLLSVLSGHHIQEKPLLIPLWTGRDTLPILFTLGYYDKNILPSYTKILSQSYVFNILNVYYLIVRH